MSHPMQQVSCISAKGFKTTLFDMFGYKMISSTLEYFF